MLLLYFTPCICSLSYSVDALLTVIWLLKLTFLALLLGHLQTHVYLNILFSTIIFLLCSSFPVCVVFYWASVKVIDGGNYLQCYLTMPFFANSAVGYRPINVYVALGKWYWQEVTEALGGNPDQVPVYPPQILNRLAWDRIWASAMRDRRLTAWTIARPGCWPSFTSGSSALTF